MEKSNWKLTVAYDGTDFHGWQMQPDHEAAPTIQAALRDAITTVTGERVLPQGAGRTDAGVHAWGQVASVSLAAPIPAENLRRALNRVLPAAIRILSAEPAAQDFHARHSATGKIYRYRIFHGEICPPFQARYMACSRWPLNLAAMQQAARLVLGEHDFTSFAATDPDRSARLRMATQEGEGGLPVDAGATNVRRIEQSSWSLETADAVLSTEGSAPPAQVFTYTVRGNGFLHHMVRNLVGTFLDAGRGRTAPEDVTAILSARDRNAAGPTAPACGLCLMNVFYP